MSHVPGMADGRPVILHRPAGASSVLAVAGSKAPTFLVAGSLMTLAERIREDLAGHEDVAAAIDPYIGAIADHVEALRQLAHPPLPECKHVDQVVYEDESAAGYTRVQCVVCGRPADQDRSKPCPHLCQTKDGSGPLICADCGATYPFAAAPTDLAAGVNDEAHTSSAPAAPSAAESKGDGNASPSPAPAASPTQLDEERVLARDHDLILLRAEAPAPAPKPHYQLQATLTGDPGMLSVPPLIPCHCGRLARGQVAAADGVPAHWCRQCSPQHCLMAHHVLTSSDR